MTLETTRLLLNSLDKQASLSLGLTRLEAIAAAKRASSAAIALPVLHEAQLRIKAERKRFNVLDCGRRFGKNILLQDFSIEAGLDHKHPVGWAAPSYKQLLEDWRNLSELLVNVTARRNEQEKQLALVGGGVIDFWSLENANAIRGRKYGRFIINEAGLVPDLIATWENIVRPTLIDLTGDAYISGTPKGRNGFWRLFQQAGNDWQHWQMSSYANPHIPKAELDGLRETMSDRSFRQEILAEFVDDGGGVFRGVRALSTLPRTEPEEGRQYVIGVDWARTNDASVFSVWDIATAREVVLDRMTDTNYSLQIVRLKALADKYNGARVIAESNGLGDPLIEQAQRAGLAVTAFYTSNATKAHIIDGLALECEQAAISFQADEVGILEMESFESSRTASGMVKYAAPEGLHDDVVMARAIARNAARMPSGSSLVSFG